MVCKNSNIYQRILISQNLVIFWHFLGFFCLGRGWGWLPEVDWPEEGSQVGAVVGADGWVCGQSHAIGCQAQDRLDEGATQADEDTGDCWESVAETAGARGHVIVDTPPPPPRLPPLILTFGYPFVSYILNSENIPLFFLKQNWRIFCARNYFFSLKGLTRLNFHPNSPSPILQCLSF